MICINTKIYSVIKKRYKDPMINSALTVHKKSCVTFNQSPIHSHHYPKEINGLNCKKLACLSDKSNKSTNSSISLNSLELSTKSAKENCFDFIWTRKARSKKRKRSIELSNFFDKNKFLHDKLLDDVNREKSESLNPESVNQHLEIEINPIECRKIVQNKSILKNKDKVNYFFEHH